MKLKYDESLSNVAFDGFNQRPYTGAFLSHAAAVMLVVLVASSMGLLIGKSRLEVSHDQTNTTGMVNMTVSSGAYWTS